MTSQQRRHYSYLLYTAAKNLRFKQQLLARRVSGSCCPSTHFFSVSSVSRRNIARHHPAYAAFSDKIWRSPQASSVSYHVRRWQHSTPTTAGNVAGADTRGDASGRIPSSTSQKAEKNLASQRAEFDSIVDEGTRVLAIAAEEGRRLFRLFHLDYEQDSDIASSSLLSLSGPHPQSVRAAETKAAAKAARALLVATQGTEALARTIRPSFLCNHSSNSQVCEDVNSLHRAFLTHIQWCLALATQSNDEELLLAENEALDMALALSARAHELSLPLHLPLYQRLANSVAQQTSVDPLGWIYRLSRWIEETGMGPVETTFFSQPLLSLCRRQRHADVANIVKRMKSVHNIEYVEATTTKGILYLIKDLIRPIWNQDRSPSRLEQDAIEVVLLLEPSIWRILDVSPLLRDADLEDDSNLREAFEAIVSAEEDAHDACATLEHMLSAMNEPFVFDPYDEEEDDDRDEIPSSNSDLNAKLLPSRDSGKSLPSSAAGETARLIYGREQGYQDFPDVASQLKTMNGGLELLYSQEFERQILHQVVPPK